MLEMRATCESCGVATPDNSADVLICSFECTWCRECAEGKLGGVCPNCQGELVRRPTRVA